MRKGYWIIGGLTAAGALGHYFLWSAFPNQKTAQAALLMWLTLGLVHLVIYAIQAQDRMAQAAIIIVPALIRLIVLPAIVVGIIIFFSPNIKIFLLLCLAQLIFFMGVGVGLLYWERISS